MFNGVQIWAIIRSYIFPGSSWLEARGEQAHCHVVRYKYYLSLPIFYLKLVHNLREDVFAVFFLSHLSPFRFPIKNMRATFGTGKAAPEQPRIIFFIFVNYTCLVEIFTPLSNSISIRSILNHQLVKDKTFSHYTTWQSWIIIDPNFIASWNIWPLLLLPIYYSQKAGRGGELRGRHVS